MMDLNKIEADVRAAAEQGIRPKVKDDLRTIELEMDVLQRLCRKPRRYIASSIDGSPLSTPTRRRRIVLKITNSVLTIIKVVEAQLSRALPSTAKASLQTAELNPTLQSIYNNLKMIQQKMEEDISPPVSTQPSFEFGEEPIDVAKLIEQAEDIKQSLEKLSAVDEAIEEPEQYGLLIKASREGRSGLEQLLTKIDETPETPEEIQEYRSRVVDLIQSLLNLEDNLNQKLKQSAEIHDKYRIALEKTNDAKEAAEEVLHEVNPSTASLHHVQDTITNILNETSQLENTQLSIPLATQLQEKRRKIQALSEDVNKKLQENDDLKQLVERAQEIIAKWEKKAKSLEAKALFNLETAKVEEKQLEVSS